MRKLLLLLLIIPLFSYSQSNDFLTKLFLDSVQIQSQDFKIELAGVINNKAQQTHVNNTQRTITEILFLKDIKVAQQFKSEVYIGDGNTSDINFKEKCTWNWNNKNPNMKMVSPYSLNYFPTFSLLKGKLLTIVDISRADKDYLFSVSTSTKYNNYGHKSMHFNLTDDDEKGYTINTMIIDEQSYIIFNKSEMSKLGFETKFVDNSYFKLSCNGTDHTSSLKNSYNRDLNNCTCKCDANYLSIFRKKTKYMKEDYNLDQDDLLYLFI